MSGELPSIDGRQLWIGVVKIALLLVFLVTVLGVGASVLADRFQTVATNALLSCLAFFMLSNGVLGILHIIDWLEGRKAKRND